MFALKAELLPYIMGGEASVFPLVYNSLFARPGLCLVRAMVYAEVGETHVEGKAVRCERGAGRS